MNEVDDLKVKLASLERQIEEAKAINRNNPSCMMPDGADPCDAYTKLRETQVKLLALHEALEQFGKCTDDCFNVRRDGPCDCGLAAAVFDASATAQQIRAEIEREARKSERAACCSLIPEALKSYNLTHTSAEDPEQSFGLVDALTPPSESDISLGLEEVEFLADHIAGEIKDKRRAAILGEKEDQ